MTPILTITLLAFVVGPFVAARPFHIGASYLQSETQDETDLAILNGMKTYYKIEHHLIFIQVLWVCMFFTMFYSSAPKHWNTNKC